jgi:hypothetical protein
LLPHLLGHDGDLLDTSAFRGVDDRDDLFVSQRPGADDIHRLVPPVGIDRSQTGLQLRQGDRLAIDRNLTRVRVLENESLSRLTRWGRRRWKLRVERLLRQWQGGHEDDQQDEEHVDERSDVDVVTGMQGFTVNDLSAPRCLCVIITLLRF